MPVIIPQVITEDSASGAQVIDGSLKFDADSSHYLNRTPASAGNRKTWTWSGWVKYTVKNASLYNQPLFWASSVATSGISFSQNPNTAHHIYVYNAGENIETTQFFRDPSSWYHIVAVIDTTQATASNRTKLYINGAQVTDLATAAYPTQNADGDINNTVEHNIGKQIGASRYLDAYLSEINFIDGSALDASYFGFTDPLTNTWRPKKYTGTYGTNGFYLPLDGNSPIGEDKSGNGNDWTPVNFGGSNTLEKATGAFPILNTDGGGKTARPGTRTDANASNLVLALPLVGSSADIHHIIKGSGSAKTITVNGDAAASSAQSNFYGGSYYFDGTGDYLQTPDSTDFTMGSGDYTIEGWFYFNNLSATQRLFGQRASGGSQLQFLAETSSSGVIYYYFSIGNTAYQVEGDTLSTSQWNHIAIVRSGDIHTLYTNGVAVGLRTQSGSLDDRAEPFSIGRQGDYASDTFNGYIQDFRIYKGVAKYTSNFIPASTDPDILPDTPSGVAGGSALDKITSGSVCFKGLGSHIKIDSSSDFAFGTGDFTVEGWYYIRESGSNNCVWDFRNGGSNYFLKCINDANGSPTSWDLRSSVGSVAGFTASSNAWNHIAVSRTSGTTKVFVNGIETNSVSDTYNATAPGAAFIGVFYNREYYNVNVGIDGFISNFRVIKGTGLYTSNFTPPTEPLTVISNTVLLCCQSSTSITDSAITPNTITTKPDYINEGTLSAPVQSSGLPYVFNANTVSFWGNAAIAGEVTYTFPGSGIAFTKLEIAGSNYSGYSVKVNGTTFTNWGSTFSPPAPWQNITSSVSSPLTSITVSGNGGQTSTMSGIRINDTVYIVNNYTKASTFSPFTTDIDESRGQETGYATLNPVARERSGAGLQSSSVTLTNGNLSASNTADSGVRATMAVSSGKWYYEATKTSDVEHSDGVGWESYGVPNNDYYVYYRDNGWTKVDNVNYRNSYETFTYGDVIGAALDLDNNTVTFYKNGRKIFSETANTSATEPWGPGLILRYGAGSGAASSFDVNFGQKPFKYAPPEGHKTLCLANLPRPTEAAVRPDKYFKTVLYTGTESSRNITDVGFKPDLVWIMPRNNAGSYFNGVFDSVRGVNKVLSTNRVGVEGNYSQQLMSFDHDGFSLGNNSDSGNYVNLDNYNYVAWSWKAGGGSGAGGEYWIDDVQYANAAAAGLSGKNITPTACSIGTKQGFSIIKYTGNGSTGQTVPHGLTQAPSFILTKSLNESGSPSVAWGVFHKDGSYNNSMVYLTQTAGKSGDTNVYTTTSQTNEHFTIGDWNGINQNTTNYISYIWHDVTGLQKFGTFEGNGSADGPFVELGFRPAMVIVRGIDNNSRNWLIDDATRNPYNGKVNTSTFSTNYATLAANSSSAEPQSGAATFEGNYIDFLSNGFKLRSTAANSNGSETYIYAAWAEAPTVNLYGAQANAR